MKKRNWTGSAKRLKIANVTRNLKKGSGLLCQRVKIKFDFIRHKQKVYPVTVLCRVMGVSRSGYYKYLKTGYDIYLEILPKYLISNIVRWSKGKNTMIMFEEYNRKKWIFRGHIY